MIEGVVTASRDAVILLTVRGPSGRSREVEAVVDTGFTGDLTLPAELASELGLPRRGMSDVVLADGTAGTFNTYGATVVWDGVPREVWADAMGPMPLVGIGLLGGHDLHIRVIAGGRVAIEAVFDG